MRDNGRIPIFKERLNRLSERFSTKAAFADFLGLSVQSVGFWLNGDRAPDAENLIAICKKLNVSADYLLGLTDVPRKGMTIREIVAIDEILDALDSASKRLKGVLAKEEPT